MCSSDLTLRATEETLTVEHLAIATEMLDGQGLFRRLRTERGDVVHQRAHFTHGTIHFAPFPDRITFTVSMTIVRSKTIDRCLM